MGQNGVRHTGRRCRRSRPHTDDRPSPGSLVVSVLESGRIDLPRLPDLARELFRSYEELRGLVREGMERGKEYTADDA
jgi:hypothetical protein